MSETRELLIEDIKRTYDLQPRVTMDQATVSAYWEAMINGDVFPPVVVFFDGHDYWLADGWHRVEAVIRWGRVAIQAEIHEGTKRDAIIYSTAANATHGLPRSNADKRRAVDTLLKDEEWSQWSDREIARRCKVSHPFVAKLRAEREQLREAVRTDVAEAAPRTEPKAVYCGPVEAEPVTLPAVEVETLPPHQRGQSQRAPKLKPADRAQSQTSEVTSHESPENDRAVSEVPETVTELARRAMVDIVYVIDEIEVIDLPKAVITALESAMQLAQCILIPDADTEESGNVTTSPPAAEAPTPEPDAETTLETVSETTSETEIGTPVEETHEVEQAFPFAVGSFVSWGETAGEYGEVMNWSANGRVAFIRLADGKGTQLPAFRLTAVSA